MKFVNTKSCILRLKLGKFIHSTKFSTPQLKALTLNSFIVTNLIGEYPRFDIYHSPLRLTPAVCASIRRSKTITNRRGSAQVQSSCHICIFKTPITLIRVNFFSFLKIFFLKVGMLYSISEGYPPTPTSKGTLFSKIALRKN